MNQPGLQATGREAVAINDGSACAIAIFGKPQAAAVGEPEHLMLPAILPSRIQWLTPPFDLAGISPGIPPCKQRQHLTGQNGKILYGHKLPASE